MTPNQIDLEDIILQDRYVIQYIWICGFISGESFRMDRIVSRSTECYKTPQGNSLQKLDQIIELAKGP